MANRSAAASTVAGSGSWRTTGSGVTMSASVKATNTSGGTSTSTGRVRPSNMVAKAWRMAPGISSASSTRRADLVMGRTMSSWSSISWVRLSPWPRPCCSIWPASNMTGDEVAHAVARPAPAL